MLAKVFSGAIVGLKANIVEVEVDVSFGLPSFNIVGLPDKAVEEAKERVILAIKRLKLNFPQKEPQRIVVNLAPADLKKEGSLYDLPIAIGFLLATEQINFDSKDKLFVGELSLDGRLRKIKGALSLALMAKEQKFKEIILPKENAKEASLIEGIKIVGAKTLKEVLEYLTGSLKISPPKIKKESLKENFPLNFGQIGGHHFAKRALEIVAAGNHNILMVGPPGSGKTLLAKALPSILPPLSKKEILEVTKIYSIAGLLSQKRPLIQQRPFRAPHHTSSEVALIGGGSPPKLGEITLAHRGVLFLDEFAEFHRNVLEALRQPLEEGKITICRAKFSFTFPAKFILVAASNPCPCGYFGSEEKECICNLAEIKKYQRKLAGPLIDRIDISIRIGSLKYEKLVEQNPQDLTEKMRQRVQKAREIAQERFKKEGILTNNEMSIEQIKKFCPLSLESKNFLRKYVDSGKLSARGYHKVLKLARTISDLKEKEKIELEEIAEAVNYRLSLGESLI